MSAIDEATITTQRSVLVDRTTLGQKRIALISANDQRRLGREWKERVAAEPPAAARRLAARVLLEEPASVGALTIHAFLIAVPRLGDCQARRMLTRQGWYIWPFRRVRELTLRQREWLAEELGRR